MARAVVNTISFPASSPHPVQRRAGWDGIAWSRGPAPCQAAEECDRCKWALRQKVKCHTKTTLTATSFSGDIFTPFPSSSSGSSFSLLSVQETESWTEQVLSKSGKLVDGYFRRSPSEDSYPRDNTTYYITCRKTAAAQ